MNKLTLPHDAYVFVGDGGKALFLRNAGNAKSPNLVTEQMFAEANPATRDQGSDKPGRSVASAHSTQRSAMEPTDWHEIEEHRFVQRASAALEALVRRVNPPALVIVAPPRALAELRAALHADVKARLIGEIDKDLTKHPVRQIEKLIVG